MAEEKKEQKYVDFDSSFDFEAYIPYCVVRTQLWMHRAINYESLPNVKAIASVSKTEVRVIMLVATRQGIIPSQIADTMGFDRALVTRAISTLVKKGLIYTKAMDKDQRSKALYITEKGSALCNELITVFESFSEKLEEVISAEEKQTLIEILNKLVVVSQNHDS
ncbi:winged helix-turn-helix transcriptional regulator [Kordiimonas sp. SCSIO 12603]|uniref:MarR family winged helix-turn-helix transcriptional regulator n=1 Tax=Kordiimonas sp. SCSIO 12603 TaxID=2829596 RepID=UPI0021052B9D|nr:MarR family winged helix-turn-helix transcriptional regulator [Kordiimonas sp. SCSIO 12603]UTW58806.1 winged helix-turn-helix transcriptional regulator [Kordiimonas sp. SCSIO 12603]